MKEGAEKINPYNETESKTEQVEEMFDSIAPAYDFMNTAMTFGLHRYWRNQALRRLASLPHKDVLDVATGTGDVAFKIYESMHPDTVTGIDLSRGMLDIARKKLQKMTDAARHSIHFMEGNCLEMPFDDESFDIITVAYGVRNFENLKQGYSEMLRVLRKGGTLCVIELSVPKNPLLRFAYNIYSHHLIPFVGKLISGDSRAYSYLPESIAACPQRESMTEIMRNAGFDKTSYRSLTFGAVTIYIASKSI